MASLTRPEHPTARSLWARTRLSECFEPGYGTALSTPILETDSRSEISIGRRPASRPAALLVMLATVASSEAAFAQISNVQPLLAKEAEPGLSSALEGSLDWRTGNLSLLIFSGNVITRYRHGRHLVFFLARGDETLNAGDRILFKHLEHLRYRLDIVGPLQVETFGQVEQDQARRVWPRALVGGGPRLSLIGSDNLDLAIAAAYMFEYQHVRATGELDDGQVELAHRLSTYVVLIIHANSILKFGETFYVQPRFDDASDLRLLSETEMLVTVTDHVAFKSGLVVAYDSSPPLGIRNLDTGLKTTLQISF